jgi:hypothetical protein
MILVVEWTVGSRQILTSKELRFVEEGTLVLELRFTGKELKAQTQLEAIRKALLPLVITQLGVV